MRRNETNTGNETTLWSMTAMYGSAGRSSKAAVSGEPVRAMEGTVTRTSGTGDFPTFVRSSEVAPRRRRGGGRAGHCDGAARVSKRRCGRARARVWECGTRGREAAVAL
jgi:hypothetical protein